MAMKAVVQIKRVARRVTRERAFRLFGLCGGQSLGQEEVERFACTIVTDVKKRGNPISICPSLDSNEELSLKGLVECIRISLGGQPSLDSNEWIPLEGLASNKLSVFCTPPAWHQVGVGLACPGLDSNEELSLKGFLDTDSASEDVLLYTTRTVVGLTLSLSCPGLDSNEELPLKGFLGYKVSKRGRVTVHHQDGGGTHNGVPTLTPGFKYHRNQCVLVFVGKLRSRARRVVRENVRVGLVSQSERAAAVTVQFRSIRKPNKELESLHALWRMEKNVEAIYILQLSLSCPGLDSNEGLPLKGFLDTDSASEDVLLYTTRTVVGLTVSHLSIGVGSAQPGCLKRYGKTKSMCAGGGWQVAVSRAPRCSRERSGRFGFAERESSRGFDKENQIRSWRAEFACTGGWKKCGGYMRLPLSCPGLDSNEGLPLQDFFARTCYCTPPGRWWDSRWGHSGRSSEITATTVELFSVEACEKNGGNLMSKDVPGLDPNDFLSPDIK
ncbi:hypothetical protein GGX14DRAFT_383922 [Mycena pura]|uniref:Uncharacterized protein n=1 Tax=Mycena pura TaxID=153505 RepID=A0AAD6YU81_9AGAR|nr:hypothetical protein GGX14DRAFT_383922 [Mycena pura]